MDDARLHLSIFGLDIFPEPQPGLVAFADAALADAILPDCSPFLDRLVRSAHSMLLTTSGPYDDVRMLQGAILKAYNVTSPKVFAKLPKPHLTLRYDQLPAATETIPALSWTASELVLVESHVGASHHEIRGRWPLRRSFRECFDWIERPDAA